MRTLTVGTDYSGIEAPIVALNGIKQKISHEFSSDICPHATKVIRALFTPRVFFTNALTPRTLPSQLDIYVAGFPCPAFSSLKTSLASKQKIEKPLKHFHNCLSVIKTCKPKVFILENVKNIKHTLKGKIWKCVQRDLEAKCRKNYYLVAHVLNTKNYGILQNRERVYIVGLRKDIAARSLSCPKTIKSNLKFEDIIERNAQRRSLSPRHEKRLRDCAKQYQHPVFMSMNLGYLGCQGSKIPPCLTRLGRGIYWSKKKILTTVREELRLQGFPDTFKFPEGMSDTVCRQLIGNSMSVNVLKAIFKQIFKETKLTQSR
jgi:DNA (cytosine-5)-methyltransferase 1